MNNNYLFLIKNFLWFSNPGGGTISALPFNQLDQTVTATMSLTLDDKPSYDNQDILWNVYVLWSDKEIEDLV